MNNENPFILIPIKTNSKRLPQKNLKMICGKKLFEWSLDAAIESGIGKVYISTSDENIKPKIEYNYNYNPAVGVMGSYGCLFHYIYKVIYRPQYLSEDPMQLVDVCLHTINKIGGSFSELIMIQPSNPLVLAKDIREAYKLFLDSGRKCVRSICKMQKSAFKSLIKSDKAHILTSPIFNNLRSIDERDYPDTYMSNGSIVVIDMGVLKEEFTLFPENCVGFEMPPDRSIDIDTEDDFKIAEYLLKERGE